MLATSSLRVTNRSITSLRRFQVSTTKILSASGKNTWRVKRKTGLKQRGMRKKQKRELSIKMMSIKRTKNNLGMQIERSQ